MKKVFISTSSFAKFDASPLRMLTDAGCEVHMNPYGRKLAVDEIKHFLSNIDFLIAGTEPLTEDVLESAPKLRVISRCGTGLDNVDLKTAERLGIKVFNTPDAPTAAVAELTVGMILDLLRKISLMDREIRSGTWKKRMGNLLSGKTVGIIGFGKIGQRTASCLVPFGCEVRYCDAREDLCVPGYEKVDLDILLQTSDIVSIHVSSSQRILGEREIGLMKKGAWLINVSRGGVIDEDALYKALKGGHLEGAALDVFEQEPYGGRLREIDTVILTPHVGSYAKEARIGMEIQTVRNLLSAIERQ